MGIVTPTRDSEAEAVLVVPPSLLGSKRDPGSRRLPVVEIFGPTVQGEGALAGKRSHFLRLGGCPRRCTWCDSMHAVEPALIKAGAKYMTQDEIAGALQSLPPSPWVTFSGGDPVMWDLNLLVSKLTHNFRIAVETQGDLNRDWLTRIDQLTLSPKPPSAGGDPPNFGVLDYFCTRPQDCNVSLKVVVFNKEDLDFAEEMHLRYPATEMFLSSGTPQYVPPGAEEGRDAGISQHPIPTEYIRNEVGEGYKFLCEEVLKRASLKDVGVFPQLHVLAWGSIKGV